MNGIKRLVLHQVAEKVRPHAHHCTQARVAESARDNLRETVTLTLLGTNIKLLPLIDVEQKGRRLGLMQLVVVACFSRVEQVPQSDFAVDESAHPT